jgi:hypothetical protein
MNQQVAGDASRGLSSNAASAMNWFANARISLAQSSRAVRNATKRLIQKTCHAECAREIKKAHAHRYTSTRIGL